MRRPRLSFAVAAAALLALLALTPLSQAKVVVNGYGTAGTLGGQFATPGAVAVNNSGVSAPAGTFYVVDSQNRVQRFSASGAFERTWGWNVVGRGEQQLIQLSGVASGAAGGTFTLTFGANTTAAIAANANAAAVQSALTALPSIGANNATVTGNATIGWTVTFAGTLGGTNVAQLVASGAGLVGSSPSISVSTIENGAGGNANTFEICTTASLCNAGATTPTTANGGQLANPQGIAVNQSTGHVYVAESGNRRISEFDADGNFVRAWGQGVATGSAILLETCTTLAGCRQGAAAGGMAGQLGGTIGYPILDSSGNVWVPDQANFRVQEFSPTGAFIKTVGGDVVEDGATGTGTLNGTTSVTALVTTSKAFRIGQTLAPSVDIAAGTVITNVGTNTLTLSKAATGSGTLKALTVAPGAENVPFNERQTIAIGGEPTGGTFTLTFTTPAPSTTTAAATAIPRNASAAELQAKLTALANIGAGNVSVTGPNGGPWTVEFQGTRFADTDVNQMTANATGLTPSGTVTIASTNTLETCTIAASCRAGASGIGAGQFSGASPGDIAFDSSGNLFALDPGGKRVIKFNPALSSAGSFGAISFAPYTANSPERLVSAPSGNRLVFAVNNTISANEREIVELDPTNANVTDSSLIGAKLNGAIGGLAESSTGTLYATTSAAASSRRILALSATPLPNPVLVNNPITTKTDSTATFSGTVDPTGGLVTCKFQYSTNQAIWTDVALPDCGSLSPGGGAQPVSASAAGLIPNSHYYVRLAVSRTLVPNTTKTSSIQEFDTDSVPPLVTNVGAVDISDTSARLVATIDPRHAATEYVFLYGTISGSPDSSTAPAQLGSGATPVTVTHLVSGLAPDMTYYFHLVATNPFGQTSSVEKSLVTRAEPRPLPENRAYEQVSPVFKGFGNIEDSAVTDYKFTVADDGQAVSYCNITAGGAQVGGRCGDYISQRTAEGWHARVAAPYSCGNDPEATEITFGGQRTLTLSRDLEYAVIAQPEAAGCGVDPLDPDAPLPGNNLYRQSFDSESPLFDLLTPSFGYRSPGQGVSFNTPNGAVEGGSADFSHVVIQSTGQQSVEPVSVNGTPRLFEWDHGTMRLISRDTTNSALNVSSALGGSPDPTTGAGHGYGAVSDDGSRIFFQSSVSGTGECETVTCELYMREGGTVTHWISQQECSPACSDVTGSDAFMWANPAGDKVLFQTAAKLVNDDTSAGSGTCVSSSGMISNCDLYMYRHSADPSADLNLTLLSADHELADGNDPSVQGVLGLSDDGNTVFFVANGQIVAGAPTDAGKKIYRWRWNGGSPTVDYLARVTSANDSYMWSYSGNARRTLIRRVDPDGKYLLLDTLTALDPVADQDGTRDVYRWAEQGGWLCLSCQVPGLPSFGDSSIKAMTKPFVAVPDEGSGENFQTAGPSKNSTLITVSSDDGNRVFFTSKDRLLSADINSVHDVYEWHDGEVSLISGGTGNDNSKLVAASRSGDDVFFLTSDKLVGWDTDDLYDMYDARVDGGFPDPEIPKPPCEGEACRGAGTSAPVGNGAGTAAFEGSPNSVGERSPTCRKGFRKVKVHGRVVCRKPGRVKKQRRAHQRHLEQKGSVKER